MLSKDWLLGYLEGQGSFSVVIKKSGHSRRLQVVADFSVKVPSSETKLLEMISKGLGNVGKVYCKDTSAVLKITKLEDVLKVVTFFSSGKFASSSQAETFSIWAKCVDLIQKGEHLTPQGMLKIAALRNLLHDQKKWNKRSFCEVRVEVDPCEPYKKLGKIPERCDCKSCKEVCYARDIS